MALLRFLIVMIIFISVGVGIPKPVDASPDAKQAKEFIIKGIARTIKVLKGQHLTRAETAERLRRELRNSFDVPTIAGFVLGPLRHNISSLQKRRYLREFEEFIVLTNTNRIFDVRPRVKSISPDIIRLTGTRPISKDQLMVHSEINRDGVRWVKIDWRLRKRNGRWLILDIIIVGISQVQVYRSEFVSLLRRKGGDIEALIAALKKKNSDLRRN